MYRKNDGAMINDCTRLYIYFKSLFFGYIIGNKQYKWLSLLTWGEFIKWPQSQIMLSSTGDVQGSAKK